MTVSVSTGGYSFGDCPVDMRCVPLSIDYLDNRRPETGMPPCDHSPAWLPHSTAVPLHGLFPTSQSPDRECNARGVIAAYVDVDDLVPTRRATDQGHRTPGKLQRNGDRSQRGFRRSASFGWLGHANHQCPVELATHRGSR